MGISLSTISLMLSLFKDGSLAGYQSVIELGSQDILDGLPMAGLMNHALGVAPPEDPGTIDAAWFYRGLGLTTYDCIDLDGLHGAYKFDLNYEIRAKYGFTKTYDVVTNHGTTEHTFDQSNAFRNAHNLCAKGGLMLHALPFQGYLNHGLFNYQPCFFNFLAAANNYEMVGAWVNFDTSIGDIATYSDRLMQYVAMDGNTTALFIVALRKTDDAEFQVPYDGKYFGYPSSGGLARFTKIPVQNYAANRYEIDPIRLLNYVPLQSLWAVLVRRTRQRIRSRIKQTLSTFKQRWRGV